MEVSYDEEADILMIVMPNTKGKKIDDTLEGEGVFVTVTKDREPLMIELLRASKFLNELEKVTSKGRKYRARPFRAASVAHQVRKR